MAFWEKFKSKKGDRTGGLKSDRKIDAGVKALDETTREKMNQKKGQKSPMDGSGEVPKDTSLSEKQLKMDTGYAYRVLLKPMISEKSSSLLVHNQYVFVVDDRANKIEVKKAVQKVYDVKVVGVNIVRMRGKVVRFGRTNGKRSIWKKAIVTIQSGQKIELYEGV